MLCDSSCTTRTDTPYSCTSVFRSPNDASTDMGAACTVAYGTGGSGGVSFAVTTSRSAEAMIATRGRSAENRSVQRIWNRSAMGSSEEHTSEIKSHMRTSYAVFCLKKKKTY